MTHARTHRSIRTTLALAALAAGASLTGIAGPAAATAATSTSTHDPAQKPAPQEHQRYAYAVLQAPGWTQVAGDSTRDGRVAYVDGDAAVSLQWHPRGVDRRPYTIGERDGATTMDGDPSPIYVFNGVSTAVGPVVNGHFVSFSSDTLDADRLADLAGQVHRQAYATLEAPGWVASATNVPTDDKLVYHAAGGAEVVLNWRPRADYGPKFTTGTLVGHARIDGRRAAVYEDPNDSSSFTVVAPPRAGKFLTFASTTLSERGLRELAGGVHRR